MKKRVLIIDDNLAICKAIQIALQDECTDVFYGLSATEALNSFMRGRFHLVIMDIHLAELDGIELLQIVNRAKAIPIIVMASEPKESSWISILQFGATVCLPKPVDINVCAAQARALLSLGVEVPTSTHERYILTFGTELIINPTYYRAYVNYMPMELTRREFEVLYCLASHEQQVLSREQIYEQAWSYNKNYCIDDAVKSCIKTLRKKLQPATKICIQNVRGVGYRFTYNN